MGDLFSDPSEQQNSLWLEVNVTAVERPLQNEELKPRKFHTADESELNAQDLVFEAHQLSIEEPWTYPYVRLGTTPQKKDFTTLLHDKDKVTKDTGVPMHEVLLGWYFDGYTGKLLWLGIDDFSFGDPDVGNDVGFRKSDTLLKRYKSAKSLSQPRTKFWKYIDDREDGQDLEGPSLPSCTYNIFDPAKLGLGVGGEDGDKIECVIRFLGHLDIEFEGAKDTLSPRWLPFNLQLDFKADSSPKRILTEIEEFLGGFGDLEIRQQEEKDAVSRLWACDDCDLSLWVLPQEHKKMYFFPNSKEGANDLPLSQFLSPTLAKSGGKRARSLYMEMHLKLKNDGLRKTIQERLDKEDKEQGRDDCGEGKGNRPADDVGSHDEQDGDGPVGDADIRRDAGATDGGTEDSAGNEAGSQGEGYSGVGDDGAAASDSKGRGRNVDEADQGAENRAWSSIWEE